MPELSVSQSDLRIRSQKPISRQMLSETLRVKTNGKREKNQDLSISFNLSMYKKKTNRFPGSHIAVNLLSNVSIDIDMDGCTAYLIEIKNICLLYYLLKFVLIVNTGLKT